jgi:hypothetical protein
MKDRMMYRQLRVGAIIVIAWGLAAGAADELTRADTAPNSHRTKILHFPADKRIGTLSIEDPTLGSSYAETGRDLSFPLGMDPGRVALAGDWDFVGQAQGDVAVPADRNIQLKITLGPRQDDLSGLSELGPSDLYKLSISSSTRRFSANRPVLESISRLSGLRILCLHQTGVTSQQMSSLKALESLQALVFVREYSFGNDGLAVLKDLPALEYLDCDIGITDIGLKHLVQLPNLRWLRIRMDNIRGFGLAYLANMPRLERLCLWSDKEFTDGHVRYLEGLTNLKSLTLWGSNVRLTDSTLASVSKLSSLEEFHLIRVKTEFTDAGIGQLAKLTNLRILDTSPDDAGALAGMKRLESVSGIALNSRNIKALASLPNLKSLRLSLKRPSSGSTGDPVAMLSELKSLEKLHVGNWGGGAKLFGDEEFASLEALVGLKDLSVPVDGLTDRGLASIGKLGQLESLNLMGMGENIRLSNRGLNHLNALSQLQKLGLEIPSRAWSVGDNTPVNLSGLTNLRNIKLISIRLKGSDWAFLADMKNLKELWLNYCGICSEDGLKYIKDLPRLKHLDLQNVNCTEGNGLAVLDSLKSLESIRMIGRITDSALGRLPGLPSLQMFDVTTDVTIRPETVARLKQILPAVRTVNIQQP